MKILISLLYALSAFNQVRVVESDSGVGTIYTYPVADVPAGFLECNGSEYKMVDYPELFNVLGGEYGERSDNGEVYFNVPDYRGYFLRGWDHGAGIDPDKGSRLDRGDGTNGDMVGTKQSFALERMTGSVYVSTGAGERAQIDGQTGVLTFRDTGMVYNNGVNGFSGSRQRGITFDSSLQAQSSTETRPVNINVLYIIQAQEDINYTTQNDFLGLKQVVTLINITHENAIVSLRQEVSQVSDQHDSDIMALQNETSQIKSTHAQDFSSLQQNIHHVNTTCKQDIVSLSQQVNTLNRTYITSLEDRIISLQQEIITLKKRLNTTTGFTPAPTQGTAPIVAEQIPTQQVTVGDLFEYTVPQATFTDADGDALTLSVSLVDDSSLPTWLNFNADTWEFLGRPTLENIGDLFIKLTATDPSGAQVSEVFSLIVQDTTPSPTLDDVFTTGDEVRSKIAELPPSSSTSGTIALILSSVNLIGCIAFLVYYCKKPTEKYIITEKDGDVTTGEGNNDTLQAHAKGGSPQSTKNLHIEDDDAKEDELVEMTKTNDEKAAKKDPKKGSVTTIVYKD